MIDKLRVFQENQVARPTSRKPVKTDSQSHTEFGIVMDSWEALQNDYKARIKEHRQMEWSIENQIEISIKMYTGLSDHPKCDDIWDYVKNNFSGHGYMELLESAEELLDIFGIS